MKIKVEPLLPTGNYLNVRIGIEKDFPDDANEMESVFQVWDNIIAMHMNRYPHLYNEKGEPLYEKIPQDEEFRGTTLRDIKEEKVPDKTQGYIQVINLCSSLQALARFKPAVDKENNEELTSAYNNKLKELQPC